jgi:hypothetical protein
MQSCIQQIDDFLHPRAKDLAIKYIQNSEDLPNIPLDFIELSNRVMQNQRKIEIDFDDEKTSLNCLESYIKKVASTEIIYLELTKRDPVIFLPKKYIYGASNITNKQKQTLIRNDTVWFPIGRPVSIESCKKIAQHYEEVRNELEEWDFLIREEFLEGNLYGKYEFKIT